MKPSLLPQLPEIRLRPLDKRHVRFGHPWVYKSQIQSVPKELKPGSQVLVRSPKGSVLGVGYFNPHSEISIRILAQEKERLDTVFFAGRLRAAADYRKTLGIDSDAIRWINSESDDLSGLILDQYADTFVIQFLTLGMDMRRDRILDAMRQVWDVRRVYERSDGTYRKLEGADIRKGWLVGSGPTKIQIQEGQRKYWVDIENGHKTGFYLDQRDSRGFSGFSLQGKRVLDGFCYSGGFAVAAAMQGAAKVLGLDISESCLELAGQNAALNGISNCEFQKQNVFDYLRQAEEGGETFDVIILDPPSFTRSKGSLEKAQKGYKEIHLRALKILAPGGMLLTFCCSHHVSAQEFHRVILEASRDARCMLKIREWFGQAKDHPVLMNIPETQYLKGFALLKL